MGVLRRRLLSFLTVAALAAPLVPGAALAAPIGSPVTARQAVPPGLSWRNIGPLRGGRSIAVAGSTARPKEYYFGATGGGLWKTTDGGTTWAPVSDGAFGSSSVGAVAVCPTNPDVVYAGMGEVDLRGSIIPGDGVYRTSDGGRTWTHAGLTDSQTVSKIRIDPNNCDRAYAAVLGHPFGRNTERGVFRTTDGAKSWQKVLYVDDATGAGDLALDPANSNVLYVGMWHASRSPWQLVSGGPGDGLFKSTDGGTTWTDLSIHPGLPAAPIGKIGIAVSGAQQGLVWAPSTPSTVTNDSAVLYRPDSLRRPISHCRLPDQQAGEVRGDDFPGLQGPHHQDLHRAAGRHRPPRVPVGHALPRRGELAEEFRLGARVVQRTTDADQAVINIGAPARSTIA
jgi:hypothetical protein